MIREIGLKNFKCFKSIKVKLAPLTVLSGINSMGKSTVMEALILLRDSGLKINPFATNAKKIPSFSLYLNNEHMRLGNGIDVLCDSSDKDLISISIADENSCLTESWEVDRNNPSSVLKPAELPHLKESSWNFYRNSVLFSKNDKDYIDFAYIAADRLGPRSRFDIPDENTEMNHNIGSKGEYAAFYFDSMQDKILPIPELAETQEEAKTVGTQVNKWMNYISPGFRIRTSVQSDMDAVQLGYEDRSGAKARRSINVGFGLTYTFPIVLALLTVRKGGMVLLENPEAHLHPKAQTMIGTLIAKIVENGAQVILETHSDHIINGIRVAVKDKQLHPEKTIINFFSESQIPDDLTPAVTEIKMDENGKLDQWPENFLSEWEDNLFKLL